MTVYYNPKRKTSFHDYAHKSGKYNLSKLKTIKKCEKFIFVLVLPLKIGPVRLFWQGAAKAAQLSTCRHVAAVACSRLVTNVR
jgi:hypothetical protein